MSKIDWKSVAVAVLAAVLAVLGGRQLPAPAVTVANPCDPPKHTEPTRKPLEAVGRLVMSGGYCSATPVSPLNADHKQVVLTAAHCVQSVGEVCQFTTRSGRTVRVTVTSINRQADAALMLTEPLTEPLPYLLVAEASPPAGTAVLHCGFGVDKPGNVETGKVLMPDTGAGQTMYSLSVSPGDSGGGICVDSSGALLSPVCCTTRLAQVGQVYGARPEVVRRMMLSPASFTEVPPMRMPERAEVPVTN